MIWIIAILVVAVLVLWHDQRALRRLVQHGLSEQSPWGRLLFDVERNVDEFREWGHPISDCKGFAAVTVTVSNAIEQARENEEEIERLQRRVAELETRELVLSRALEEADEGHSNIVYEAQKALIEERGMLPGMDGWYDLREEVAEERAEWANDWFRHPVLEGLDEEAEA